MAYVYDLVAQDDSKLTGPSLALKTIHQLFIGLARLHAMKVGIQSSE